MLFLSTESQNFSSHIKCSYLFLFLHLQTQQHTIIKIINRATDAATAIIIIFLVFQKSSSLDASPEVSWIVGKGVVEPGHLILFPSKKDGVLVQSFLKHKYYHKHKDLIKRYHLPADQFPKTLACKHVLVLVVVLFEVLFV